MTRKRDWSCHDVEWCIPGRRRPVGWTTQADSDLIRYLSDDEGLALDEVYARLTYEVEARRVVAAFIEAGLGPLTLKQVDELHRRGRPARSRGRR